MTEPLPDAGGLLPRAEFYLLLSAVLDPGNANRSGEALGDALLEDLAALGDTLPAVTPSWLSAFRTTLAELRSTDQPLKEYSRLFLVPPAPCPLNLGYYLDGGLMGRTVGVLDGCYHRYGLERNGGFHDLPDHLSLNLQWLAWVIALAHERSEVDEDFDEAPLTDALGIISDIALPATGQIETRLDECVRERALSGVWPALVRLVRAQLAADRKWLSEHLNLGEPSESPAEAAVGQAQPQPAEAPSLSLTCRVCGTDFIADEAMAMMVTRLREAGLATDHMEHCPNCQSPEQKAARMTPPGARRFG